MQQGAHLVEPPKAHAATLDPAPKLGDDQEVGEAAGLHLQVLLHDVVWDGGGREEKGAQCNEGGNLDF